MEKMTKENKIKYAKILGALAVVVVLLVLGRYTKPGGKPDIDGAASDKTEKNRVSVNTNGSNTTENSKVVVVSPQTIPAQLTAPEKPKTTPSKAIANTQPANTAMAKTVGKVAGVSTSNVFKLENNPTVYTLTDGQLRPFTSATAFFAWGFKFDQVQTISVEKFNSFVTGAKLGIADGAIVKSANSPAFIVVGGKKNLAAPVGLVTRLGLSTENPVTISESELAALPNGPAIY